MKINKAKLYVALQAIIRLERFLLKNGYFVDHCISINIEKIKKIIVNKNFCNSDYDFESMIKEVDKIAVDFEEANDQEAIINYFVFAFSTLIFYFLTESDLSLESVCEDVIQFYRNIAENNYFESNGIDGAMLTDNQIQEIENSSLILNEKVNQDMDGKYSKHVHNWGSVSF